MPGALGKLRKEYHRRLCTDVLGKTEGGYYNNADGANRTSRELAEGMADRIGGPFCAECDLPSGQGAGAQFAKHTAAFLEKSFALLKHLRPGNWTFSTSQGADGITGYDQYSHLADLRRVAELYPEVRIALGGDYLILPDVVVGKYPVRDDDINETRPVIQAGDSVGGLSPFRAASEPPPKRTLHASISMKWTIRSDRAQNTRTEALNLLRNRKGKAPQMIIVTAEPLPRRIMSIAVGTGDIDCTYHAALYELLAAVRSNATRFEGELEELETLISGRRLRDISDLPFDLAI